MADTGFCSLSIDKRTEKNLQVMDMKKIRWGIVGTGRIANTFAQALKGCPDAQLYAAASRTYDKAADFADKHGFEKSYGSYEALAGDKNVDIVYIATPMASHLDNCILCMEKGKHVLCEKSVCLNSIQLEQMLECARKNKVFFMEAMWMKCSPTYQRALEWVRRGRIGKVLCIRADFSNLVPYDKNDRLFDPMCAGGALLDVGVYPLTLAYDILGECDDISGRLNLSKGVDMSGDYILDKGDAFARLRWGFDRKLKNDALITGDKGSILFGEYFHCTDSITLFDNDGKIVESSRLPVRINGYEYEIEHVHSCLSKGALQSDLVPHRSTAAVMKIMDSIRKSSNFYYPGENAF